MNLFNHANPCNRSWFPQYLNLTEKNTKLTISIARFNLLFLEAGNKLATKPRTDEQRLHHWHCLLYTVDSIKIVMGWWVFKLDPQTQKIAFAASMFSVVSLIYVLGILKIQNNRYSENWKHFEKFISTFRLNYSHKLYKL
jgi:hypothetical protein